MTGTFTTLGGQLVLEDTAPRPTEDPLWLAATMPQLPVGSRVLDAGCGSGIAGFALQLRQPSMEFHAADNDPGQVSQTIRNAARNNLQVTPHITNILEPHQLQTLGTFDAILCNPPYHGEERGHTTPNPRRQQAHSLPAGDLTRWLHALTSILSPWGTLHLILHSACEAELTTFATAHHNLSITPLQTSANRPPKRLIATLALSEHPTVIHHPAIPAYSPAIRKTHLGQ